MTIDRSCVYDMYSSCTSVNQIVSEDIIYIQLYHHRNNICHCQTTSHLTVAMIINHVLNINIKSDNTIVKH